METLNQQSDKSWKVQYIIGGLVAISLLLAFAFVPDGESIERRELHLGTVTRSHLVRDINAPGRFVPIAETWLTARVDARVKRKLLEAGATLTPDTVILELTAPELSEELERALLDVKVAEARLDAARAQQQNDFRQQQADVELLKIEKDLAAQQAEARKILADRKIITGFEYQADLLRVEQLKTQLRIGEQQLAELPALQASLLRVDEVEVEQLRLRVELLQDQVDSLKVRSGIHGILQNLPLEEGQRFTRGAELARVSDQSRLKVELNVQEAQAKDLRVGQTVDIDTRRSRVAGQISRIDPVVNNGTVLVDVTFTTPLPEEARPELRVDGRIEIERLDSVLTLAKPMAWRPTREATLFRIQDGVAEKVDVTYGASSTSQVQLLSGLNEGDQVILSDTSEFESLSAISIN